MLLFRNCNSLLRKSTLISSDNLLMYSLCRQTATWILTFVGENHPFFECGLTMTWRRYSILITYTRPYQSEWINCLSQKTALLEQNNTIFFLYNLWVKIGYIYIIRNSYLLWDWKRYLNKSDSCQWLTLILSW